VSVEEIKDLLKPEAEVVDIVKSITIKKGNELFKGKTANPDKLYIELELESGARVNMALAKGLDWDGEKWLVMNKHQLRKSLNNENSILRKFIMRYEKLPEVGMTVFTKLDKRGFPKLAV